MCIDQARGEGIAKEIGDHLSRLGRSWDPWIHGGHAMEMVIVHISLWE